MSRGPGKIQQSILKVLQENNVPVQRNKLLWKLANTNDKLAVTGNLCEGIPEGYIEPSYEKAFQRSLKRLAETDQVKIKKQKLRNIDEFIAYYPYKTTWLEICQLRTKLLPHIKSYLEGTYYRTPFTIRDNEIYILDRLQSEQLEKYTRYSARWKRIERKILTALPALKRIPRNRWLKLIIKGQELFIDDRARYGLAFHNTVKDIEDLTERLNSEEIALLDEVKSFMRRAFPPQLMKHSRLKNKLYVIGNFNERTTPSLKREIKMHFLDKEPVLIQALPEHLQPDKQKTFGKRFEPSFSPKLDSLIDRHVFSQFEFLSIQ